MRQEGIKKVILSLLLILQKEDIFGGREDAVGYPLDGTGRSYPIHGG